jgi:transglutaminase-like putative cysteine protease
MRVETPFGLVLQRISRAEALRDIKPGEARELIRSAAILPTGPKPFRGATSMRFVARGLPDFANMPEDELQRRIQDDEHLITTAAPPETPVEQPGAGLDAYLLGDPFVQSGHPQIIALVEEITAKTADPWEKAQRIYQWVYTNIEKSPVISLPSALDVLKTRQGDCNEHTVLYTALARAADVPTRMAIGVVWSDELDGFYYHAWPEVYVGGWVPVDPTLGQPIADATHIKLLEGSIEQWPRLTPYLGQLDIEVLDVH